MVAPATGHVQQPTLTENLFLRGACQCGDLVVCGYGIVAAAAGTALHVKHAAAEYMGGQLTPHRQLCTQQLFNLPLLLTLVWLVYVCLLV